MIAVRAWSLKARTHGLQHAVPRTDLYCPRPRLRCLMPKSIAWINLLLLLAALCSTVSAKASERIIGGTLSSSWRAVGMITTANEIICTATLIGPSIVLSAAHCFEGPSSQWPTRFITGPGIGNLNGFYRISRVDRHPDYNPAIGTHDIAVVSLTKRVGEHPMAVRVIPLDAEIVGSQATIVGYGRDENGLSGFKREAETTVTTLFAQLLSTQGPPQGCFGDSGGPIIETSDGPPLVFGVLSFSLDEQCQSGSAYQRVDTVVNYLLEFEGICFEGEACESDLLFRGNFDQGMLR